MSNEVNKLNNNRIKLRASELILFYILFGLAIFFTYTVYNNRLCMLFFFFLIGWAWFSKNNYFWIAFFFLLIQGPGYLFTLSSAGTRIALKPFNLMTINYFDVFTLLMFMKTFFLKKTVRLRLNVPFSLIGVYFIFSFFIGAVFYSTSSDHVVSFLRPLFYSTWIISFLAFVNDRETVFKFFRLLLPVTFFILFTQFYFLVTGREFVNVLQPWYRGFQALNTVTRDLRPIAGGFELMFMCYMGALMISEHKKKTAEKGYLALIIMLNFLSIFVSATRVWFALFLFIAICVYFGKMHNLPKIFITIAIAAILLFSAIKFGLISEEYLRESAWGRISQGFYFISGRPEAIDTYVSRLDQLKPLTAKIYENPFFGHGFSDVSYISFDCDWGFFNTFLMFGIFGFSLFVFLFFRYLQLAYHTLKVFPRNDPFRDSFKVLLISFWSMLIGYFVTQDFFTPYYPNRVAFIMLFFGISEIFMRSPEKSKNGIEYQ